MKIRNCAFSNTTQVSAERPVWARRNVSTSQCPKSIITGESLFFIEQFQAWKRFGGADIRQLSARTAEALLVLEEEWQREIDLIRKSEGK